MDLFLRENLAIGQIRQFSSIEKIKIKSKRFQNFHSSLFKEPHNRNSFSSGLNKNWSSINKTNDEKSLKLKSKKLVIYPYSLSDNLLKEVLLRLGFQFVLTNEVRKASLIIGLKKHLKQNFQLTRLAKEKSIPIYSINQVSFYQISKLIQFLSSSSW